MSTPNFTRHTFSDVYAIEVENDFDIDDAKGNILSELKDFSGDDEWERDGHVFAYLRRYIGKNQIDFRLVCTSGYYTGASFDVVVDVYNEDDEYTVRYGYDELPKYITDRIESTLNRIKRVYRKYTTPLLLVGVFSNGEAVYQKVKA